MTQSLISLIQEGQSIVDQILENNGEITPAIEEQLATNEMLVAGKVDRIVYFLEAIERQYKYFSLKSLELQRMSMKLKSSEKQFKEYLKMCFKFHDTKAVYGISHKISTYKIKPTVVIDDSLAIPMMFKKAVVTYEIDKEKIREALMRGEKVEGASLKESYALRVGLNSKQTE